MAVLLDDFNRADSTSLGTASSGGFWTPDWGNGGTPGPDIVGNAAKGVDGNPCNAYHSNMYGPRCFVGFQITALTAFVGLVAMTSNIGTGTRSGYEFDWAIGTTGNWDFYKTTTGTETGAGSGNTTAAVTGDYVRLVLDTANVRAEKSTDSGVSWTTVATLVDTTHRSATTQVAFIVSIDQTVDNLIAGEYPDRPYVNPTIA